MATEGIWKGAGAAGILGGAGLIGGLLDKSSAKESADAQRKENALNREFQEQSAKRQHQWEVADLKKAGLNPILSAGGSGSGTLAGSSTAIPPLRSGASSAMEAAKLAVDIREAKSRTELNDKNAALTGEKVVSEKGTPENLAGRAVVYGEKVIPSTIGKGNEYLKNFIDSFNNENSAKVKSSKELSVDGKFDLKEWDPEKTGFRIPGAGSSGRK